MPEKEDMLDRVDKILREPVELSPDFSARVMTEIRGLGPETGLWTRFKSWLGRPQFELSPLAGLSWATAIVAVTIIGVSVANWTLEVAVPDVMTTNANASPVLSQVQFVLVAPDAQTVTVVGDFNDWDDRATPLVKAEGDGIWSVTVPLTPGRYQYSFIVDGTRWLQDPRAVPAVEDEFGRPSSVLTIGEV